MANPRTFPVKWDSFTSIPREDGTYDLTVNYQGKFLTMWVTSDVVDMYNQCGTGEPIQC